MNFWWYIIIGEAVAIIIFIILAMRKKWRIDHGTGDDPIEHYTEKRDELSGLEDEDIEEEPEEESVSFGNFNPVKLITSLVTFGITMYVFWTIWNTVTPIVNEQMNTTGMVDTASVTLINSMTGFLPIIAMVGFVFVILSAFGLGGGSSDDDEVEEPPKKRRPRKKGVEHYTAARDTMSKPKVKK